MSRTCRLTTKGNRKTYLFDLHRVYKEKLSSLIELGVIRSYNECKKYTNPEVRYQKKLEIFHHNKYVERSIWNELRSLYGKPEYWKRHSSYSKNPSHWNRDFNNVPKRREAKMLCKKIKSGYLDADNVAWPINRKPNKYYW